MEDVPDELRKACEHAMTTVRVSGSEPDPRDFTQRIVLNGHEYASEEEMPHEERLLYKMAVETLKANRGSNKSVYSAPIEPVGEETLSRRSRLVFIVGGVMLALLLFLYLLSLGY